MADIRVVCVAYNPGDELAEMISSIQNGLTGSTKTAEVVVVNNGTHVPLLTALADQGVTVIDAGANLGYGTGNNLGARGFTGDWLMIVNPDVRFTDGSITRMLEVSEQWPHAGVFGPKILTPEGEVYPSARHFPRLIAGTGHALLAEVWPANPWTAYYHATGSVTETHRVDWLSGSCLLARREAFEAVGGFDEDFFMFFEDTMLGEDMRRAGWHMVFVHDAVAIHDKSKSWRERPAAMVRAHHQSAYLYLSKVYNKPVYAPVRAILRAGLWLRMRLQLRLTRKGMKTGARS